MYNLNKHPKENLEVWVGRDTYELKEATLLIENELKEVLDE